MQDISIVAVLVAGVANYALGALWYSPLLFGKTWMSVQVRTKDQLQKDMNKAMGIGAVAALLTALGIAYVIALAGVSTVVEGIQAGALLWILLFVPTVLYSLAYEGQNKKAFLIIVSYQFVAFLLMGAIISLL